MELVRTLSWVDILSTVGCLAVLTGLGTSICFFIHYGLKGNRNKLDRARRWLFGFLLLFLGYFMTCSIVYYRIF